MTLLLALGIGGCTSGHYSKSAHRETRGILRFKKRAVPNSGRDMLDITPPRPATLEELAVNQKKAEFLGDRAHIEKGAKVLTLADALRNGVHRNRTYLDRKETLYLEALDLTLARHQFAPIFSATGSTVENRVQVEQGVNTFVTEATQTSKGNIGFSALTKIGTRISADLSSDFMRFITGQLREVSDSKLAVTLTQPLLRGAGYLAVTEVLTQAERSLLYSVRDFTQYRKTFTVDITSQYYRTLQARDAAKNAHLAYLAFKETVLRERGMEEANRRSLPALLQLEAATLSYDRRWLSAIESYEAQLDALKLQLGLPVSAKLMLDEGELSRLQLFDPPGSVDDALTTALSTRLDLQNSREGVEDAKRRIKVAKQDLLPSVGAVLQYDITGAPNSNGANLDARRRTVSPGLDVDLQLDKKAERNVLRAAEVAEQKSKRDLELQEETLRLDIRADWRALDLAKKQYQLAIEGLKLAERRLEVEYDYLIEGKSTSARDYIDAQQDLIEARDQITSTLITHTLARLKLWKDMGILFITKDGAWDDVLKTERPKGE